MTIRTSTKVIALLGVYAVAMLLCGVAYVSFRDRNVTSIKVVQFSQLDQDFELVGSSLRVKDPDFLKVCFSKQYAYALKDAQKWFAASDTEFASVLRAAGGRADVFNGRTGSSIVLLSRHSARIVQFDARSDVAALNVGCTNIDAGNIQVKRLEPSEGVQLSLLNATLKERRGDGPLQASVCVEQLQRFVESVDELLAENAPPQHLIALMADYMPEKGCTPDEVAAIAKASRFCVNDPPPVFTFRGEEAIVTLTLKTFGGLTGRVEGIPHWTLVLT